MTPWIDLLKRSALRVLRHRRFLAGCIVAALVVRLLFIALFDAQPLSDFVWYFQKGLQIMARVMSSPMMAFRFGARANRSMCPSRLRFGPLAIRGFSRCCSSRRRLSSLR